MNKLLLLLIGVGLLVLGAPALAHEGREVGEYVIVLGWRSEPAYTGLLNGPEFTVEHHDGGEPVTDLESTLTLEARFGDRTKVLRLRAVWDKPGHYTADLIPTRPGDYTFRLSGTIGELAVDELFSSADGEFSTVEPIEDIQFP